MSPRAIIRTSGWGRTPPAVVLAGFSRTRECAGYNRLGMASPGHLALTPEIDDFRRQFERVAIDADALVSPLTDVQFNWRPAPGNWSVAECLEHLNTTARLYLPSLDEGVADAIRRGLYAEGPFAYNWIGRLFVRATEPPARFRMRAPRAFHPAAARPRHEILAAFRAYQVQFVDRLRQANGLDLARARVSSPASRWIRLPLGSAFAVMAAHQRRHLSQAQRVTAAPAFPSG